VDGEVARHLGVLRNNRKTTKPINTRIQRREPHAIRTDLNNPDPDLQDRPVIGLLITKDFVYNGKGLWHKGTIYDPDNGKTYKCKIKFGDNEKVLKVRGFVGISLLGRTTYWTRVQNKG
jgi:uncharacterized protein (DUF2147 family)